jgi:hypothetical protein
MTPFYALADELEGAAFHLFAPGLTIRLRGERGFRGEAKPGVVSYGYAGVSPVRFDAAPQPDGTMGEALLDAGANPPDGVVVQYYLREAPTGEVALTFLGQDGGEIRSFSSTAEEPPRVPAAAGINRFVWNLRSPGVAGPTSDDLQVWQRPDGPLIVPGAYQVRLTVDGASQTQPFELVPDPRLAAVGITAADSAAQRALLLDILAALGRTNETIDVLDGLLAQVALWKKRTDDEAVQAAVEAIETELKPIRSGLIDVNMKQSQLWPSGLHEKFNGLFDSVDRGDAAPPSQARAVYDKLVADLDDLTERLKAVERTQVAALNKAIGAAKLPVVGLVQAT